MGKTDRNIFDYPDASHVRRHGPSGYGDCRRYKPWLRDEFTFRCVYCLTRERWLGGNDAFGVDHLVPASRRGDLARTYGNLAYACNQCNSMKQTDSSPVLDPCQFAFGEHVTVDKSGHIKAASKEGKLLIGICRLDRPLLTERRERILRLLKVLAGIAHPEAQDSARMWLGFPTDLPNLSSRRPPGGNSKPEGVKQSYYARRERGELPEQY